MADPTDLEPRLQRARTLFHDKIGGSSASLARGITRKGHRLPRSIRRKARQLAVAEPLLAHPKLRLTQDAERLGRDADDLIAYLDGIDLADQRKGWWLGMLGAMVFNLLLLGVLLVVGLRHFALI